MTAVDFGRKVGVLALATACFATGSARATGMPVVDISHIGLTMNGWSSQYAQMYAEYAKQLEQLSTQVNQLQTQVKQYQQMYVRGAAYKPEASYREDIASRFPQREMNQGVADRCGDHPKPNMVGEQQRGLCVATVQTQNRRYNAMREFLLDVQKNDLYLGRARAERAAIAEADQGALQANTNKMASIQSKMENDLQNAKYTMDAYNAVLSSLNADTVRLAEEALKNRNGLLGVAAQGAALKLALQTARARER